MCYMNEKCYVSDVVTFKRCHTRESTQKLHVTEQVMQKMSLPCQQGLGSLCRNMRRDVRGLHSTAAHHSWTQLGARAGLTLTPSPTLQQRTYPHTLLCSTWSGIVVSDAMFKMLDLI